MRELYRMKMVKDLWMERPAPVYTRDEQAEADAAVGEQLHLRDGEPLATFVRRGIELVFQCLATELGDTHMTEDTAAGMPFQLATKCNEILATWDWITER